MKIPIMPTSHFPWHQTGEQVILTAELEERTMSKALEAGRDALAAMAAASDEGHHSMEMFFDSPEVETKAMEIQYVRR
jgi:hypothetical protein